MQVLEHVSFTVVCYDKMFIAYKLKNVSFVTTVKLHPI
jgi:hypothetical protein